MSAIRSRGWVLTLNNPTDSDRDHLQTVTAKFQYFIFGEEVGESGTPHLQAYGYFSNARKFDTVRRLLPRWHVVLCQTFLRSKKTRKKVDTLLDTRL